MPTVDIRMPSALATAKTNIAGAGPAKAKPSSMKSAPSMMTGRALSQPPPAIKLPESAKARLAAADRGRSCAQTYRKKPTSAEAIRAMVRAEIKQESQECRQRTMAQLAAEEEIAKEEQQARQAVRDEARRVYRSELRADLDAHEQHEQHEQHVPPPPASEAADTCAEWSTIAEPAEPAESASERIAALMREREERRAADAAEMSALRERVAARKPASGGQWAPPPNAPSGAAASRPAVSENRSLFTWTPPAATAAPAPAALPVARSDAAKDALAWLQRPPPAAAPAVAARIEEEAESPYEFGSELYK